MEEDVLNPGNPVALWEGPLSVDVAVVPKTNPVALWEGPLSVDVAVVPKTKPVVDEVEGCTAALEILMPVVSGIRVFQDEGFVLNSPPVAEENKDSAVLNE